MASVWLLSVVAACLIAACCGSPSSLPAAASGKPSAGSRGLLSCDFPVASPELGLLNVDNLCGISLRAAVLVQHPAGEPLRYPEHGAQRLNSFAALFLLRSFPRPTPTAALGLRLEHRLLQLSLGQMLLLLWRSLRHEAGVFHLQLSQPFGFISLNAACLLTSSGPLSQAKGTQRRWLRQNN